MVRPPGRRVEDLDETVNAFRGTRWIAVPRCRPADPGAEGPVERWSRAGSSLRPGAGRTPRPGAARTDGVRARTGGARHRLAGTTALPMTRPGRRRRSPAPTRCGAGSAGGCWTRGITAGRSRRSGPAGGAGPARDRRRGWSTFSRTVRRVRGDAATPASTSGSVSISALSTPRGRASRVCRLRQLCTASARRHSPATVVARCTAAGRARSAAKEGSASAHVSTTSPTASSPAGSPPSR